MLASGQMTLQHLLLSPKDPKTSTGAFDVVSVKYTAPSRMLEQTYRWGKLVSSYEAMGNGIAVITEVRNTGASTIDAIHWDLMQVRFPRLPEGTGWKDRWSFLAGEPGSLPAVLAEWNTGSLATCNEDMSQAVVFGLRPTDKANTYALVVHLDNAQIKPGGSARYRLAIRLGAAGTPAVSLASAAYAGFAKQHPFELNWSDRRAIGTAFLATSDTKWKTNPRGWFMDQTLDTTTDAGRKVFRERKRDQHVRFVQAGPDGILYQLRRRHCAPQRFAAPREGKQLIGKFFSPHTGLLGFDEPAGYPVLLFLEEHLSKGDIAEDDRKKVVEVVGDPTCQNSQGFELARL